MSRAWRTVKVFISSTFRDMQAERDLLVQVVFPALRERLERHRVYLVDIDLRWGVTREQAENDQALELCLQQIDDCRPFFLGLLGQRYGWVPPRIPADTLARYPWLSEHAGKSVTELEIIHGALAVPGGRQRAFFCFRDPLVLTHALPEARAPYEESDPERARQLEELKDRLRRSGHPVMDGYPAAWVPSGRIDGMEALADRVREQLWQAICEELGLAAVPTEAAHVDAFVEETDHHERFMESRLRVYVGREETTCALREHIEGDERAVYLVTGPSGAGKSAALAQCVSDHRRRRPHDLVLAHFTGASPRSTSLRDMLRRLCLALQARFGSSQELPEETPRLASLFRRLLNDVPPRSRTVIVLDGLNQLDEAEQPDELSWLPEVLPPHVKVIVSCLTAADRTERVLDALLHRRHRRLEISPLNDAERREVIRAVPSLAAKTLDPHQVGLLLANPATANPLFLLVALEELRGFGSFEGLNARIDALPRQGETVVALFQQVIERLEREFDAPLVRTILTLLVSARRGLSEREIQELSADAGPAHDLFPILRQLRPYLLSRGTLLDCYHHSLAEAIGAKYLATPTERQAAHGRLAHYFQTRTTWTAEDGSSQPVPNVRKVAELPWQLLSAGQTDQLTTLLTDLSFLEAKTEAGLVFELVREFQAALAGNAAGSNRRVLELLEEIVRTDGHFLAQHPDSLFACLWNRGWWYDTSAAASHYRLRANESVPAPPWENSLLAPLLERWRADWEQRHPGRAWVRSLRPPEVHLGTAQRAVFRGHEGEVTAVAYAPDGQRVASGSGDGTIRIWDAGSGEELACLSGHRDRVRAVAFSPDGRRLASGSWDRSVRIWDARSGAELLYLRGCRDRVWSVAWSPDGLLVAAGADDDVARIWNAQDGERVARLHLERVPIWGVVFSPDGRSLGLACDDGQVRIWDYREKRTVVLGSHDDEVMCVAFAPDGQRLASASGDRSVRIWDVRERREARCLRGHGGWVGSVAWSPDGQRIASGSWDTTVRLWDAGSGRETACLRGHQSSVWSIAFAPDGRSLASASGDGSVRIWDVAGGGRLYPLWGHRDLIEGLAFAPNGRWLASASRDGTVRLWDANTGVETACLRGHEGIVRGVAVSPDSTRLASAGEDRTIRIWDLATSRQLACLRGHTGEVWKLAWSNDGGCIASGSDDRTVRLWDAVLGSETACLRGHTGWICGVVFSSDGQRVASAGGDNTVRVWDTASGHEHACLSGLYITVTQLAFTPEATGLYLGSTDHLLRFWELSTGDCREVAEGLHDVAAVAAGLERFPWIAVAHERKVVVRSGLNGAETACFPGALKRLVTHPSGRCWAGTYRNHLCLIALEQVRQP